jgi:hypothetical protein
MHMVLLFVGVLSGTVGMAMLAYGTANTPAAIGNTLIIAGTTALVGGLIIIGLGAVVSRLRRLAEALDRQPLPRIAGERFDVGRFEPAIRAALASGATTAPSVAQTVEAPSTGGQPPMAPVVAPDTHEGVDSDAVPSPDSAPMVSDAAAEVHPVDREPEVGPVDEWPHVSPPDRVHHADARSGSAERRDTVRERYQPTVSPSSTAERPAASDSAAPAPPIILKSGVLDGMAYTLYSDGSIEAELREGTKRFRSIPELRAYIFERPQ